MRAMTMKSTGVRREPAVDPAAKVRARARPTKISRLQVQARQFSLSPLTSHLSHNSMNAESYLRKQGWKGSGHSLDSTGRGIKKPLLIAHKQDQLGLGKKKAAWTTDDQWW